MYFLLPAGGRLSSKTERFAVGPQGLRLAQCPGMAVRLTVARSETGAWIVACDGTSLVRFCGPRAEEMAVRHHRELAALYVAAAGASRRRVPVTAVMSEFVKRAVRALFTRRP
jgi:hypothetical protein